MRLILRLDRNRDLRLLLTNRFSEFKFRSNIFERLKTALLGFL